MTPGGISRPVTRKAEIVAIMRREIEAGVYDGVPDRRLPSREALLKRFGEVSEQVIKSVYAQLVNDGYVIARPRDGYFVRSNDITVVHADTYERRRRHEERFA